MNRLKMHSKDWTDANIAKLAELFPNCVTEVKDEEGKVTTSLDFDLLRQELSDVLVEGPRERYRLDWPGKREALLAANAPIAKSLRPCREESVDFDTTENLFIEGDNLDALKLLQETYLGKVKMIYIDPPYNTGKDFIYADNFAESADEYLLDSGQKDEDGNRLVANTDANGRFHSDWLSMMYSRLKLARNLLRDDGVIFISIDDGEQASLKRMCDEVFGEGCFVANAVWQKAYVANMTAKHISNTHDHVLIYCRDFMSLDLGRFERTEEQIAKFKNPDSDPRGPWKAENLPAGKVYSAGMFDIQTPDGRTVSPPPGRYWRCNRETYEGWLRDGRITFGVSGQGRPMLKKFLSEVQEGITPDTWWAHGTFGSNKEASIALKEMFEGKQVFDTPKPQKLLSSLIRLANDPSAVVLDFFAGSAVTAHSVMQLNAEDGGNRKFIMVQLPEACDETSEAYKAGYPTIAEISKERIRRAGTKIKEELAVKAADSAPANSRQGSLFDQSENDPCPSVSIRGSSALDTGFRVLKVDSSNMADVYYTPDAVEDSLFAATDNIKPDRTAEDLLFQVLLEWGVDLSLPITTETVAGIDVHFVEGDSLAACFATNGEVTEAFCRELAKREPLRVVFRDAGFKDDSAKINAEQIFKQLSPGTDVRCL